MGANLKLREIIQTTFSEWLNQVAIPIYHLGGGAIYSAMNEGGKATRHCLNPFLQSECDIQVKFGGFLDQRLLALGVPLTVHAEMKVYEKFATHSRRSRPKADLSIHDSSSAAPWKRTETITDTLRAVIEIKYANYKKPDYEFGNGRIKEDFDRLGGLKTDDRYLMLIDECNRISRKNVERSREWARQSRVTVLSNNPELTSA